MKKWIGLLIFCLGLAFFYFYPHFFNTKDHNSFSLSNFPPFEEKKSEKSDLLSPDDGLSLGSLEEMNYAFNISRAGESTEQLISSSMESLSGEVPLMIAQGWEYRILDERLHPDQATLKYRENPYGMTLFEDGEHYYLESYLLEMAVHENTPLAYYPAIRKSQFPNLQILGFIGEDMDIPIGYSNGYLVVPSYAFPVDKKTFSFAIQKTRDRSLDESGPQREEYLRTHGRRFFRNGGKQYANYIGQDKDWVYRRSQLDENDHYALLREKKKSDFKLLSFSEIKMYETTGQPWDLKLYSGKIDQTNWQLLSENNFGQPELMYYDNHMYSLSDFGMAVFPIDGATMSGEGKKLFEQGKDSITSYALLSDKNYYYQLVYHYDGSYYTLQRTKK